MYEAMLVASVVIFIAVSVIYVRHPAASIFHPLTFYLAFHGLVFVIRPIFAWYYDFNGLYLAIGFTPTMWDKVRVLICTNISVVVFAAVSLWIGKNPITFKQEEADLEERSRLLVWFAPFAIIVILAGFYVTWWIIQFRLSGAATVDMDRFTGDAALTSTNGYFLGIALVFGAVTVAIAYFGRFRLWSLAPFGLYMVIRFATGSRGPAVTMAVVLALLYIYDTRSKWPKAWLLLPGAVLVLTFNTILNDRGLGLRTAFGLDTRNDYYSFTANSTTNNKPLETMDLSMMECFEFLVATIPEKTGTYDYFLSNSQLLVAPIPRVIWKDKPVGAPIKMFELYRYGRPLGVVYSVAGMGWYYLGYIGVIIWSAFFAFIYTYFYRRLVNGPSSNVGVLAYATLLSTSVVGYRDGLLYSVLAQNMFYLVPAFACLILMKIGGFPPITSLRTGQQKTNEVFSQAESRPFTPRDHRLAIAGHATSVLVEPRAELSAPTSDTPRGRRRLKMNE